MTFTELVTEVMARTRQTSDEARTRVGREINDRYRRVGTSIGLETARLLQFAMPTVPGVPSVTLGTHVKPITVWLDAPSSFRRVLVQITMDDYRARTVNHGIPQSGPPVLYAVGAYTAGGVPTLYLYPTPDAVYTLQADVIAGAVALAGTDTPAFPADFHDVLMYGALADEWQQLKQDDLESRSTQAYESRLAELRYFIAKSNTLALMQNGRNQVTRWMPPAGWRGWS